MLQDARFTAFGISNLLCENRQVGLNDTTPPIYTLCAWQIRVRVNQIHTDLCDTHKFGLIKGKRNKSKWCITVYKRKAAEKGKVSKIEKKIYGNLSKMQRICFSVMIFKGNIKYCKKQLEVPYHHWICKLQTQFA